MRSITRFLFIALLLISQAGALSVEHDRYFQIIRHVFELLGHPVATMQEANEFAQKNLLRTGERWEVQTETELHAIMKKNEVSLRASLEELYVLIHPQLQEKHYRYALVMGTIRKTVLKRINYVATLCQQGYTFDTIVLLGGQRHLLEEEKLGLPASITTESELMEYLYNQHPDLNNKKMLLVDAPMIQKADGTLTRPTTDSTLEQFSQMADEKGTCLVISNGHYTIRQTLVAARILSPLGFYSGGAGKKKKKESNIIMLMDEFARIVYEIHKSLIGSK